jgi:hypothetical protein
VANVAGLLGGLLVGLRSLGSWAIQRGDASEALRAAFGLALPSEVGYVVLGAALSLALRGRCRPASTWDDWLGLALGLSWVAMMLSGWALLFLILAR